MILRIVKSLCYIIPGMVILISVKKEIKKELYIMDDLSTILVMSYVYMVLRWSSLSYKQYILIILIAIIVMSFIKRLLFGYYQNIYSEDAGELKNIITRILTKEEILFDVIENKVDYQIIFKFSKFKIKRIVIQIHMKGIQDKIKYFTIYFKNMSRKETLLYMNEIAGFFDERQIFKKRKTNIITYLIGAVMFFGIGVFIFLKNF